MIPQYDGLKVERILDFAADHPQVFAYLPVKKEMRKISRQYLGNVIYTVVGARFNDWVNDRVNERHQKFKEKKEMMIHMDPEIAQIFLQSSSVSTTKGTSSFLMKASSKRRRTRLEIDEDKQQE